MVRLFCLSVSLFLFFNQTALNICKRRLVLLLLPPPPAPPHPLLPLPPTLQPAVKQLLNKVPGCLRLPVSHPARTNHGACQPPALQHPLPLDQMAPREVEGGGGVQGREAGETGTWRARSQIRTMFHRRLSDASLAVFSQGHTWSCADGPAQNIGRRMNIHTHAHTPTHTQTVVAAHMWPGDTSGISAMTRIWDFTVFL